MELRQLIYFQSICRQHSFTHAAETLHVSQPNLTKQIHNLEQELGLKLLDRRQRRFTLTSEGTVFLQHAEKVLQDVDDTYREMRDLQNLNNGTIRLCISQMIGAYLFPYIFTTFRSQYPKLNMIVSESTSMATVNLLEQNDVDIGLILLPVQKNSSLHTLEICREQMVLVLPPEHPLNSQYSVDFHDLVNIPFIARQEDSHHRRILLNESARCGFSPNIVFSSNRLETIISLVANNIGVAILMEMVAQDHPQVTYRPFSPPLYVHAGLAWKRHRYISKATAAFIDFVRAYAAKSEIVKSRHFFTAAPPVVNANENITP